MIPVYVALALMALGLIMIAAGWHWTGIAVTVAGIVMVCLIGLLIALFTPT